MAFGLCLIMYMVPLGRLLLRAGSEGMALEAVARAFYVIVDAHRKHSCSIHIITCTWRALLTGC